MYIIEKICFRKNKCWYFQVDGETYYILYSTHCLTQTQGVDVKHGIEYVTLLASDVEPYLKACKESMVKHNREALVRYLYDNYLKYYGSMYYVEADGNERQIIHSQSPEYFDEIRNRLNSMKPTPIVTREKEHFSQYKIKAR